MQSDTTDCDHLAAALADPEAGWSLGTFGAAIEFHRTRDEAFHPVGDGRIGLRTRRGGLRLHVPPGMRPFAYETPIGDGWSQAVALCLPESALDPRPWTRVTERGPDREALDPARRGDIVFDLGFGLRQVAICIRTADPALLANLRARLGGPAPDFDREILPRIVEGRAGLVFAGPLGRAEVFPAGPGGVPGPRAHVVPRVLRLGRSHVATAPIPPGLVPCAHLHPPHPCRDRDGRPIPFDRHRHAAFQAMLLRWGDRDAVALKARLLTEGPDAERPTDRRTRALARVARAQADHIHRGA